MPSWEPAQGVSQCSQGWITGLGRGYILAPCVNMPMSILHRGLLSAGSHCAQLNWSGFFQLLVLRFFETSGCASAGLWVSLPCVLPWKMKHGPLTSRREVPASCPLAVGSVTILLPVWQFLPGHSHWCGHCTFPTLGVLICVLRSPVLSKEPVRAL